MERNTNTPGNQKENGANCNAKVSTGFYVFLVLAVVLAVICWLILR